MGKGKLFSFAFFLAFSVSLCAADVTLLTSLAACKLETVIVQVGGSFEFLSFGYRSYQNHKGL
ncbi:hypothetical protein BCR42DRAFT_409736 [Absidia repens]|uniref:Uncharacterized protein n=1 Tax=Absidia repens TaxID=90262 RepID=A0A1X2IN12_9FUNG|nr:hypothetical protein BCR42DRAFT_409736 [Absidia repens]